MTMFSGWHIFHLLQDLDTQLYVSLFSFENLSHFVQDPRGRQHTTSMSAIVNGSSWDNYEEEDDVEEGAAEHEMEEEPKQKKPKQKAQQKKAQKKASKRDIREIPSPYPSYG